MALTIGRINVVGTSGTGKSTFAKALARQLGFPYVEMDKLFWGPNWTSPSDEDFSAKVQTALNQESWVLDGNYTRTVPIKWQKIDWIIWLDFSFPVVLYQATRRAIKRILTQEELWEGTGNRETFLKTVFSKDSVLRWTINTYDTNREKYEKVGRDPNYSHIHFFRLKNRSDAADFLRCISEGSNPEKFRFK